MVFIAVLSVSGCLHKTTSISIYDFHCSYVFWQCIHKHEQQHRIVHSRGWNRDFYRPSHSQEKSLSSEVKSGLTQANQESARKVVKSQFQNIEMEFQLPIFGQVPADFKPWLYSPQHIHLIRSTRKRTLAIIYVLIVEVILVFFAINLHPFPFALAKIQAVVSVVISSCIENYAYKNSKELKSMDPLNKSTSKFHIVENAEHAHFTTATHV